MKNTLLFLFLSLLMSCNNEAKKDTYVTSTDLVTADKDGYVGVNQCMSCHKEVYETWKGSDHELAMQVADEATVLGDFNDVEKTIDGVSYVFTKKEEDFVVSITEIDGTTNDYKISYTFGVTPLQQYLIDFPKGQKQVLRVTWDVVNKRWYHQYSGDEFDPHDWLHWTKSSQNWNTMCAECHSTNLKKNYDIDQDAFNTSYSAINVSCESCHGPAEQHVNWANTVQDSLHSATYMLSGKGQFAQMNMCAPCHSRRVKLTQNLVPGELYEDQYMLQNLSTEYYHADGQIDEEDYVYGSFLQSNMYHNGVTCTDCHNPHSLKLKEVGNNLCMQCHEPKYDAPTHHFHKQETESAQCINCHMTGVTYMGNDFRRDHSFRVPRPDQSVAYNTPNACNNCHSDKSNQWAADKIVEWYGPERQDHFSDALILSSQNTITDKERNDLYRFINDLNYPAIARASVIDNLQITEPKHYEALLEGLSDASPRVRYAALQKFRGLNSQERTSIALKHVTDTTKLVRIGAAQLLIELDVGSQSSADVSDLSKAKNELEVMLNSNADFSVGRSQLGDYYLQRNDVNNAIKHYKKALEKDSLLIPVYSNMATAYSMQGQTDEALNTLAILIEKAPDLGRSYYLRALLYFELKQDVLALADLNMAISLEPSNSRYYYNKATYEYQNKLLNKAESTTKKALQLEPRNPDYKYLLALIYKEQGKTSAYDLIMQELNVNQNNGIN